MAGVRAQLKNIFPEQLWPMLRWCDRWVVYVTYVFYFFKRLLLYPKVTTGQLGDLAGTRSLKCKIPVAAGDPLRISEELKAYGIKSSEGRHSVYVGSENDLERLFPGITSNYPQPVGLKIIRSNQMAADGSPYYTSSRIAPASTWFSMRAVGSVREKMIISNLLSMYGVAPRCYDLVHLEFGEKSYFGLVVEHVAGKVLSGEIAVEFMRRFRASCSVLGVEPISIQDHKDLRPPTYNNNIVCHGADPVRARYVDMQNFALTGKRIYKKLLKQEVSEIQNNFISEDEKNAARVRYLCDMHSIKGTLAYVCIDPMKDGLALLSWAQGRYALFIEKEGRSTDLYRLYYLHGYGNFSVVRCLSNDPEEQIIDVLHAADTIVLDKHNVVSWRLTDRLATTHRPVERDHLAMGDLRLTDSLLFFCKK